MVHPVTGEEDHKCELIRKAPKWEIVGNVQKEVLASYTDQITETL